MNNAKRLVLELPDGRYGGGWAASAVADAVEPFLEAEKIKALKQFYAEVCTRAEKTIEQTHRVEGAHYNAMKSLLAEMGIKLPN